MVQETQFPSRRICRSTSNFRHETEPQQNEWGGFYNVVSRHTRAINNKKNEREKEKGIL